MKRYDIIVIGAGAAGLVIAIASAHARKKVLMIEKGLFGGDCTNYGCIPSKSLIASAKAAHFIRFSHELGLETQDRKFQAHKSLERVRKIISEIRSHEDASALRKKNIDVIEGIAEFIDPHTVKIRSQEKQYRAKNIVIATGSHPNVPSIEGIESTPFLTNETVFNLKEIPKALIVLGGGPIGCELAQAFQRLGSMVKLIHTHANVLSREPLFASDLLKKQFTKEKMELFLNYITKKIHSQNGQIQLTLEHKETHEEKTITGDQFLVCVGRRANFQALNLQAAKIAHHEKGILVDQFGRTTQKHVFAVGDIAGPPFFTHFAEYQARSVLKTLLIPFFRKKVRKDLIPRVTYTSPEIASIGLSKEAAESSFGKNKIACYEIGFDQVDRAITQSENGMIQIITKKWSSKILGACIVGTRAGEMIGEILIAMHEKIPLRRLSDIIHPYPTYNLAFRKAADLWLTQTILPLFQRKK